MGKQNVQAKEVYCVGMASEKVSRKFGTRNVEIWPYVPVFWRFSQFFGLLHLLKTLRGKMTKNFFVLVHALFDVDLIEKNRSAMRTCKGF